MAGNPRPFQTRRMAGERSFLSLFERIAERPADGKKTECEEVPSAELLAAQQKFPEVSGVDDKEIREN